MGPLIQGFLRLDFVMKNKRLIGLALLLTAGIGAGVTSALSSAGIPVPFDGIVAQGISYVRAAGELVLLAGIGTDAARDAKAGSE